MDRSMDAPRSDFVGSPRLPISGIDCEPVSNGKHAMFSGLQGYFLCQHDVTGDKPGFGGETQSDTRVATVAVDFDDVHRRAMVDSVPSPAVTASNVKVPMGVVLSELFRREPFSQELQASRIIGVRLLEFLP
jgi:hypothetical protein